MNQTVAATSTVPAHVMFFYIEESMFNNVTIRSMYRAKTIKDSAGESQVDDYAMSGDERDAFNIFLSKAVHEAFNIVMKMTTGIESALILNGDPDTLWPTTLPDGVTEADVVFGFKIKDHDAYNVNNISLVDEGIKSLIENHILREWYEMVGHADEFAKWNAKYLESKRDLISKRLFQLRKPMMN